MSGHTSSQHVVWVLTCWLLEPPESLDWEPKYSSFQACPTRKSPFLFHVLLSPTKQKTSPLCISLFYGVLPVPTVSACEILHHHKDCFSSYKSWDVYRQQSTGDSDFATIHSMSTSSHPPTFQDAVSYDTVIAAVPWSWSWSLPLGTQGFSSRITRNCVFFRI